jgi:hypothetical protein
MNIFLPYENNIEKSVQALDDLRLNKQVLECYQLLSNSIKEFDGREVKGYKNHPIYVHYKTNIPFLAKYGYRCCCEYAHRFHKSHKLMDYFMETLIFFHIDEKSVRYKPFYMEGSKGQPNYIRTTENVGLLYINKLCNKWDNDKEKGRPPKWTNRGEPKFYFLYKFNKCEEKK